MKDKTLMALLVVTTLAAIFALIPGKQNTPVFNSATTSDQNTNQSRTLQSQDTGEIKFVTPAQYETEMAGQVLIQLCKPETCSFDRQMLEGLPSQFIGVKFVQMSTAENSEFTERLEKERSQVPYANANKPSYPLYIFKGADLAVAPEITSKDQLKQFIEMNASYERPSETPETQTRH